MKTLDSNGVSKLIALTKSALAEIADAYFVPITASSSDTGLNATTTAVHDDVKTAISNGKSVWAKVDYLGAAEYIPLVFGESGTLVFSGMVNNQLLTVQWDSGSNPQVVTRTMLSQGDLSNANPASAGIASPGTSVQVARSDHVHPKEIPDGLELGNGYLILSSSTADSTKKFKITVDDSGTLTATEVTTTT